MNNYTILLPLEIFCAFPEISNILSRIKLIQQGKSMNSSLKQYETIIATAITNKTIQDILRKYLNSLSDNGFSGVSSGQRKNIHKDDIALIISKTF